MSEFVPTAEQVNAFKTAWHEADDDGQAGKRVEIALAKVLGPALAAARREGQAEGWDEGYRAGAEDMSDLRAGKLTFQTITTNPYRQEADRG